jgi:hypothetical protein
LSDPIAHRICEAGEIQINHHNHGAGRGPFMIQSFL